MPIIRYKAIEVVRNHANGGMNMEKCKVLIVDDELLIRQGIRHYVKWEEEGFEIVGEAGNGQVALELVKKLHPHIVITDIVMPIMDGEELTKTIKQTYPDIQIIILSSFSDFEYVRSTFQNGVADYILKPTLNGEDLLKALKKAAQMIPHIQLPTEQSQHMSTIDTYITRILNGIEVEQDEVMEPKRDEYKIIQMNVNADEQICMQLKDQLPIIYEQIIEHHIVIVHYDGHEWHEIMNKITKLAQQFPQSLWVISRPFKRLEQAKERYEETKTQMRHHQFYLPNQQVFEMVQPKEPIENKKFDLDYFIRLFQHEQFSESFSYLDEYVQYITHISHMDEQEFKSFLGNILFNMTVILSNLQYKTDILETMKFTYLNEIGESSDSYETIEKYHNYLQLIKDTIEDNGNKQGDLMKEILNYIHVHYTERLTLSEIAEQFHFNSSYLSAYFSANYRVGVNDYINELRIKKAKELLESSKYSISDISGKVGYSEHSYFCKVFKRDTGTSPSQYRRMRANK